MRFTLISHTYLQLIQRNVFIKKNHDPLGFQGVIMVFILK